MHKEQLNAAQKAMTAWLSDPHALGKKPNKIECAGEFDFNEMHYYIFKFKAGVFGKWLVGVCGGFEDGDLEPCGHIYSDMQEYNEATAQNECIAMVEKIMAYWMEQAKRFENIAPPERFLHAASSPFEILTKEKNTSYLCFS